MSVQKFAAMFADRSLAYAVGGILENLFEPAPTALTIFEAGHGAWRLDAYFDADIDFSNRDLNAELGVFFDDALPTLTAEPIPDLNWVAVSQAALPPVKAGRFTIHGSHDRHRVARGPNAILIDAGEAFGTAHHATTLGCLRAIDHLTRRQRFARVLDLGCGSGVLAIAVARADPGAALMATDLDPQSVVVATENVRINGVAERISLYTATGVAHPKLRRAPAFDLVIANILAGPLLRLAGDLSRTVAPGGALILSGLLIDQAPQIIAAYRAVGFHVERHDRITGWATLTLIRR